MKLISKLVNSQGKKSWLVVMLAGFLAVVTLASTAAADATFNIFPIGYTGAQNTDYPFLDARNVTKGESWSTSQTDHDAGVTADPGDILEFLVYYHNGAADADANVANNVVLSSNVPSTNGSQFTISSTLSASNAPTITSSSKGGDITVRINGTIAQNLALVAGSTIWLPNRGTTQQSMPDTITSSGISLGNIRGCWNYSGFVKYRVRVSQNTPPLTFSIVKDVRNVTTSGSFADTANASPSDTVEFRIVTTNTGGAAIPATLISDSLPSLLTYIAGSISAPSAISGDLFSGGLNYGVLNQGASITITFRASVAAEANFPMGTTQLTNTAQVTGTGATTMSDTARVLVLRQAPQYCSVYIRATFNGQPYAGTVNYTVAGPTPISDTTVPKDFTSLTPGTYTPSYTSGGPSGATFSGVTPTSANCPSNGSVTFTFQFTRADVYSLTIVKDGRNVTTGTAYADSTAAQPSQTVAFRVVITNTSNTTATNVIARDVLPSLLTYVDGSLTVNGASVSCPTCFFSSNVNLGSMAVNETKTIVFNAAVAGQNSFPVGTTVLTNTGYVRADSVSELSDTATVTIEKTAPQKENGNAASRPL
jgi:uncharacterized repeat protein (TIGR01451 family)